MGAVLRILSIDWTATQALVKRARGLGAAKSQTTTYSV